LKQSVIAFCLVLLTTLTALLVGAAWLIHSEEGLQFAVVNSQNWINGNSDQHIEFGEIRGTLWDGVDIEFVKWQQEDTKVEADQIQIVIDWSEILDRMVRINTLSAQVVRVDSPPSEENTPLVIPEKISVPIDLDLHQLEVQQLLINGEELKGLSAKASIQSEQLSVDNFSLNVRDTQIKSTIKMGLARPYPLSGEVNAQRKLDDMWLNAQLAATGTIERLELALDAKGENPAKRIKLRTCKPRRYLLFLVQLHSKLCV